MACVTRKKGHRSPLGGRQPQGKRLERFFIHMSTFTYTRAREQRRRRDHRALTLTATSSSYNRVAGGGGTEARALSLSLFLSLSLSSFFSSCHSLREGGARREIFSSEGKREREREKRALWGLSRAETPRNVRGGGADGGGVPLLLFFTSSGFAVCRIEQRGRQPHKYALF
eukprot:scaffold152775_cov24-Tisochrysis_lutea.AAC.1